MQRHARKQSMASHSQIDFHRIETAQLSQVVIVKNERPFTPPGVFHDKVSEVTIESKSR